MKKLPQATNKNSLQEQLNCLPALKILSAIFILLLALSNEMFAQTYTTPGQYDVQVSGGTLTITATGADGGRRTHTNNLGGAGGDVEATFNVSNGDWIRVVVGGAGASATNDGGGGGGSAVFNCGTSPTNCDNNTGTLLVVAGGGGGAGSGSVGNGATNVAGNGSSSSGQGASTANQGYNASPSFGSRGGFGFGHGGSGFSQNGGGGGGYTGGSAGSGNSGGNGGSNIVNGGTTVTNLAGGNGAGGNPASHGFVELGLVLPVELIQFNVRATAKSVHLIWETASETNNHGFEIEQSRDGRNWHPLGFVNGHGTTQAAQSYAYTDERPLPGVNYYRLRQVDFDGKFEYSDIRSVVMGGSGNSVAVYPNPVKDGLLNVDFATEQEGAATLRIFDTSGRVLHREVLASQFNQTGYGHLPAGVCFIEVISGQEVWRERLIVQ